MITARLLALPLPCIAWAPAGMGKRGHLPHSGNVVKCFCALVVTAKRSVGELFMLYFHNMSSASGGSIPGPHRGTFIPRPLICPPPEKIPRASMRNELSSRQLGYLHLNINLTSLYQSDTDSASTLFN